MKVGAVSLWLLLLLSERPMYGYEIKKELEKKFAGYWKPKTGTIYPALEKLEESHLLVGKVEFQDGAPERKHYAMTEKGHAELASSMAYWTKMTEVLENYWEAHQALFRHKGQTNKAGVGKFLKNLGDSLKDDEPIELSNLLPSSKKVTMKQPTEPIELKFLYAKEKPDKHEIHLEIEWSSGKTAQKQSKDK